MYKINIYELMSISHHLFIGKRINLLKSDDKVKNYIGFLENRLKVKFIKSNNFVALDTSKNNLILVEHYLNRLFSLKEMLKIHNLKTIPKNKAYT